jgi:hypothetical protein
MSDHLRRLSRRRCHLGLEPGLVKTQGTRWGRTALLTVWQLCARDGRRMGVQSTIGDHEGSSCHNATPTVLRSSAGRSLPRNITGRNLGAVRLRSLCTNARVDRRKGAQNLYQIQGPRAHGNFGDYGWLNGVPRKQQNQIAYQMFKARGDQPWRPYDHCYWGMSY